MCCSYSDRGGVTIFVHLCMSSNEMRRARERINGNAKTNCTRERKIEKKRKRKREKLADRWTVFGKKREKKWENECIAKKNDDDLLNSFSLSPSLVFFLFGFIFEQCRE